MYEQLSLFEPPPTCNPIEDYANHGTGFVNGKNRVIEFFKQNKNLSDRADFLKNEYGVGGFGFPIKEANCVHEGNHSATGHDIEYFNENMENVKISVSHKELAKVIAEMIENGRYEREEKT